ncbi:MAG: hypothetical protein CFE26_02345 [Verrucomicrobiales bacterium VVV1]|nr:MAG: hypothetical protein CFE26_02345 [Verrucomicrobiales bacterium VVV1]
MRENLHFGAAKAVLFSVISCFFVLLSTLPSLGNSELRQWKLASNETFEGEIVNVNEGKNTVTLRINGKGEREHPISDFSASDRAWILEWIETGEELEELVKKLGGKIEHFEGQGAQFKTGFHVYHPSGEIEPGAKRPVMFLFDPSGQPLRYLMRHVEAGEAVKMTLITFDYFRNKQTIEDSKIRFSDVLPCVKKAVPHDDGRMYLGGTSGGAMRAFFLAMDIPEKWAGIYANGGNLGGINIDDRTLPRNMRIALVNGDKDFANSYVDSVSAAFQKHGAIVSVMAFEGAHQTPPSSAQTKAFKWLLKEIN